MSSPWESFKADVIPELRARWRDLYPANLAPRGGEFRGPCPLHGGGGDNFSLSPETLRWTCFSGCAATDGQAHAGGGPIEYLQRRDGLSAEQARDALAALVGVDLTPRPEQAMQELDDDALAKAWRSWCGQRRMDPRRTAEAWGVRLQAWRKRPAAVFATPSGDRVRFLDSGKPKTMWRARGGSPCWYGLREAPPEEAVYLVNGEPSVWACAQGKVPAVCTCAGETASLRPELLAQLVEELRRRGTSRVDVIYDLDAPGQEGAARMVLALRQAGIGARALLLPEDLGQGGDVDDLHRRVGDDGLRDALEGLPEPPPGETVVANFRFVDNERYEVPQAEVVDAVHRSTGGWPRTLGGLLFAADPPTPGSLPSEDTIRYLDGSGANDKLMTWLRRFARVEWCGKEVLSEDRPGKRAPLTRGELHRALEMAAAPRYDSLELTPHHPLRPATYYACGDLPDGDGTAIAEFMEMLNPATPADADLLCAALLTPGWGGEPGCRPGFVLTSDHGVGSGKTATAEAIAAVWGGATALQPHDDWQQTVQRLLSDDALSRRLVLVDNVRGRLASGAIESAITTGEINGKRMYYGDFRRTNTMTWFLTINVAELSRDLADRCVVIQIGPPRHEVDFRASVAEFLKTRRYDLVCDCLAYLRGRRRAVIAPAHRDRFQSWQDGVLACLPNGDALAAEVCSRRASVDADATEAQEVLDALAALLRLRGHCPDHGLVFVPSKAAFELFGDDLGCRTKQAFGRHLRVIGQQRSLRARIDPAYRHAIYGRGVLWRPEVATSGQVVEPLRPDRSDLRCPICRPFPDAAERHN